MDEHQGLQSICGMRAERALLVCKLSMTCMSVADRVIRGTYRVGFPFGRQRNLTLGR